MRKVKYQFTENEDYNIPNNNYSEETEYEIFEDDDYTFGEYLRDICNISNFDHDEESDTYYITDPSGERTGEAFLVLGYESTESTESIEFIV